MEQAGAVKFMKARASRVGTCCWLGKVRLPALPDSLVDA